MVVAAKDEFCARIDRLHAAPRRGDARRGIQRRRDAVHVLTSRRGLAGLHGAGRDARPPRRRADARAAPGDRAHWLPRASARASGAAPPGSRPATCGAASPPSRSRLVAADSRLARGRRARATSGPRARFARSPDASRRSARSPSSARGYAVCWNEDRTAIIRQASAVGARRPWSRVTLHEGRDCDCEVRE